VNTPRMVLDLIVRPDAFFTTVSKGPASLFTPAIWLVAAGIVMSAGLMAGSDSVILKSGFGNVLFLNLLALVLMIITVMLAWTGVSGIFYALSHRFGGTGSFSKTLENTGYGLAAGFILYGLILLLGALVLTVFQVPVTPFGSPVPGNLVVAGIVTGGSLIAALWAFILMSRGLRHSMIIPPAKAAVSVGVPVLVFVIFSNLHYLAA